MVGDQTAHPAPSRMGRPRVLDMQEVFNAIQFMLGTGCPVAGDMQGNPPFVGAKFGNYIHDKTSVRRIPFRVLPR